MTLKEQALRQYLAEAPAAGEEPARPLPLISLTDLLAETVEETRYIWQGILPVGGVSLLAAKPKVGKSTLARNLMLSVAQGQPFLGRDTLAGPVVYLALEEMRAEVRDHFARLGGSSESIATWFGSFNGDPLSTLTATIQERQPLLVVVDPLIRLARFKDTNDYSDVNSAFEPFTRLARETGCHIMFVHHLGKRVGVGADAILGSTAIFANVDTALLLQETSNGRMMESTQRYGNPLSKTWLDFDPATGQMALGQDSAEALERQAEDRILELLADCWMTEGALWRELGGSHDVNSRVLRRLVESGLIVRQGEGKKGNPYRYSCQEE